MCRLGSSPIHSKLVAVTDAKRSFKNAVELRPARNDDSQRKVADNFLELLIEFADRRHTFHCAAGLATGLPHCTEAGSPSVCSAYVTSVKNESKTTFSAFFFPV